MNEQQTMGITAKMTATMTTTPTQCDRPTDCPLLSLLLPLTIYSHGSSTVDCLEPSSDNGITSPPAARQTVSQSVYRYHNIQCTEALALFVFSSPSLRRPRPYSTRDNDDANVKCGRTYSLLSTSTIAIVCPLLRQDNNHK